MALFLYWLLIAFQLLFAAFMVFLLLAFVTGAPFVPSSRAVASVMVKLAHLRQGTVIYDLGSGDGRLLFLAAREGARAVGIEINPYLVAFCRIKAFQSPYRGQIRVLWRDLWRTDLREAQVVFVYLLPWRMEALAAKLKAELKPGSLIVTNSFMFPGWQILRQDAARHVYVYKVT